jgi:aromatic ring hydroxylase
MPVSQINCPPGFFLRMNKSISLRFVNCFFRLSLPFVYAIGNCALIDLLGVSTGFVESFAKSQGITNFSNIAKKLSGILIIFAGVYILLINL